MRHSDMQRVLDSYSVGQMEYFTSLRHELYYVTTNRGTFLFGCQVAEAAKYVDPSRYAEYFSALFNWKNATFVENAAGSLVTHKLDRYWCLVQL